MTKGPKQIRVLMVNNGAIGWKKVVDFGAFLALQTDKDKWMAWAKGKPLLIKSGFAKKYTYLLTPEIAWTLDGDSIVNIMAKAKALAYPAFKGIPGNGHPPAITAKPELLPPEKPMTEESVNGIIDNRLNNGIRTLIHDEVTLAFESFIKTLKVSQPASQPQAQPLPTSNVPTPPPTPEPTPPAKSEPEQRAPTVPEQPTPPVVPASPAPAPSSPTPDNSQTLGAT